MFKYELTKEASDNIRFFIWSYLNSFLSLFSDSWIEDVYKIEENYIKIAKDFKINIYSNLNDIFIKDIILGRKISEWWRLSVVISVWNFRLFVYYLEDKNKGIRFIENIEFHRK